MIHTRTDFPKSLLSPVQGDERGERRNGYPSAPYLPRDPGRRTRLLRALGYLPASEGNITGKGGADLDTQPERSNAE